MAPIPEALIPRNSDSLDLQPPRPPPTLPYLGGGWDYLTEENAARSVDLLPELTDAVARLLEM